MLQLLEKRPFFEELLRTSKKVILVLAISMPVTDGGEEIVRYLLFGIILERPGISKGFA